jgi:hypothetical protein
VSLYSKGLCDPFSFVPNKIDEFESNSKIKNIGDLCRCISDFKKGYQRRTNAVKDETDDLIIVCDRFVGRCRKLPVSY